MATILINAENALNKIQASKANVGFMENATYPDGLPVAAVAFWNEYGTTHSIEEHLQTIYRSLNVATGSFNKNGKFVKKSRSNYETTHKVDAYSFSIPPRPFFRNAISQNKDKWMKQLKNDIASNLDSKKSLSAVGLLVRDDIIESIIEFKIPENRPSTVRKKGFNKPLIGKKPQMVNSVTFTVS